MRLFLFGAVLILGLIYAARCAWRPLVRCKACDGSTIRPRRSRLVTAIRGPRACRRCQGTGARILLGRRLYDRTRKLQRAGSR
jgi:hypothetical protein